MAMVFEAFPDEETAIMFAVEAGRRFAVKTAVHTDLHCRLRPPRVVLIGRTNETARHIEFLAAEFYGTLATT